MEKTFFGYMYMNYKQYHFTAQSAHFNLQSDSFDKMFKKYNQSLVSLLNRIFAFNSEKLQNVC